MSADEDDDVFYRHRGRQLGGTGRVTGELLGLLGRRMSMRWVELKRLEICGRQGGVGHVIVWDAGKAEERGEE